MRHKTSGDVQMHVLLNVPDRGVLQIEPADGENQDVTTAISSKEERRSFLLQPEIMSGVGSSVMATFYDLYEDGLEDILAVRKGEREGEFTVAAYTNVTQDSDAYFVKVIVLSGICYHDCTGDGIQVPYGTNLPGQTICYRTQRPDDADSFMEIK